MYMYLYNMVITICLFPSGYIIKNNQLSVYQEVTTDVTGWRVILEYYLFTDRLCIKSVMRSPKVTLFQLEWGLIFVRTGQVVVISKTVTGLLFITIPAKRHQEFLEIMVTTAGIEKLSLFSLRQQAQKRGVIRSYPFDPKRDCGW